MCHHSSGYFGLMQSAAVVDVALESHRLQRKIAFMCAVLSGHFTLVYLFSDAFDLSM